MCFCFFKKKTAYEMRISDWSSDVCSSDLFGGKVSFFIPALNEMDLSFYAMKYNSRLPVISGISKSSYAAPSETGRYFIEYPDDIPLYGRSEEHTSELQSLMRNSYAVFCLKKKNTTYSVCNLVSA